MVQPRQHCSDCTPKIIEPGKRCAREITAAHCIIEPELRLRCLTKRHTSHRSPFTSHSRFQRAPGLGCANVRDRLCGGGYSAPPAIRNSEAMLAISRLGFPDY